MDSHSRWRAGPSYQARLLAITPWLPCADEHPHLLEIGSGESGFACWAAHRGYAVTATDLGSRACTVQRLRASAAGLSVEVQQTSGIPCGRTFHVVCAFEVIEHVPDDVEFLHHIRSALLPSGTLLLTVPAHMRRWSRFDDLCGHVRRYERVELQTKLRAAGFEPVEIKSIGFPVVNALRSVDTVLRRRDPIAGSLEQRSELSGTGEFRRFPWLMEPLARLLTPAIRAQSWFSQTELGQCYAVRAIATQKPT